MCAALRPACLHKALGVSRRIFILLNICILFLQVSEAVAGRDAIVAPLAIQSLLLDVVRVNDRIVAVGERGHILVSTDQGEHWRQSPVPTQETLTSVYFLDEMQGWAAGHGQTLVQTTDGGETWLLDYENKHQDQPILDLWFDQAGNGFAIGAYGLFLVRNKQSGEWIEKSIIENDYHLNHLVQVGDTLYISAEAGQVLRSADQGVTWHALSSPYAGSFYGALAIDDQQLLVFGLRGHLYAITPATASFSQVSQPSDALLTSGMRSADRLYIAGLEGTLLVSEDAGRSFHAHQIPNRRGISKLLALDQKRLLLVGEGGVQIIDAPVRGASPTGQETAR